ncbi:phosphomannomutase/phosphoglucomutase, partial [Pseudoxanthomonas taiwanensis]
RRRRSAAPAPVDEAPTLGQTLKQEPRPAPAASTPAAPAPAPEDDVAVDPAIFRAYDIRGVVGSQLDAKVAARIGQAIGTVMAEEGLTDIVVGRDGRLSGPELVEGLVEGLRKAGRNVIDIGMVPTPVVYFAAYHLRAGSGVAVTGSHNPPDYNGFKIVVGGQTLSGEAIVDLYARIRDGRLRSDAPGSYATQDVAEDYVRRIADDVQLERPLKVVADAGNGVAGEIAPRLLEAIGAEVVPLYCDVDGTFPNHHPDPSEPRNLEDLVQTVRQFDADLGVAFDGDGDRLGVVTREGRIVYADRLLMLYAADVLQRNPGAMVIYDVKCTGRLQDYILRHGGSPQMWKTGHSLIKAKMRETEAELAGEMSGHFFFKERWYGFDDGLYAAARLLEILAGRFEAPSEVLDALPDSVSTPEIKVALEDGEDPHVLVERFTAAAQAEDSAFAGARLTTIDGLRADWNDGWGLLRASNTTPVLVLRFEADDEPALARIRTLFREQLQPLLPGRTLPF